MFQILELEEFVRSVMKATGIVRRIDELGRVVIPKEIRKTMHIKEGTPLEIYTSSNGDIVFRKYSPVGEALQVAEDLCATITETTGLATIITDTETVVAVGDSGVDQLKEIALSQEVVKIIEDGKLYEKEGDKELLLSKWADNWNVVMLCPVLVKGELVGSVAIIAKEQVELGIRERVLVKAAADILSKQMNA